jgi:ketosteroid isomerase-like protein
MHTTAGRFTGALHRIDSDRDVRPMVGLTGDDAERVELDEHHQTRGKGGTKTFQEDHRNVLGDLETTFTHHVVGEDSAALEWTSTGTLRSGKPFRHRGVTVIEGDEERLTGVRTYYYDSAAFVQERVGTA